MHKQIVNCEFSNKLTSLANDILSFKTLHCVLKNTLLISLHLKHSIPMMLTFILPLLFGTTAALQERTTNYGSVTLYDRRDFKEPWVKVAVKTPDTCYNLDCFNNKASSAAWDLPGGGSFDNTGYLTVFADMNCKRKLGTWSLLQYETNSNLAMTAYMNDNVSSILVDGAKELRQKVRRWYEGRSWFRHPSRLQLG